MKGTINIQINYSQAVRLLSLIDDGREILRQQHRPQRGIDGYTANDLSDLEKALIVTDRPAIVHKIELAKD